MKPVTTLGETRTPDGSKFTLMEHDGDYFLKLNGTQLMSTTWVTSELLLADVACSGMPTHGTTLIGGLGLGFSLKRVLQMSGKQSRVIQAELLPEVIEWNRVHLQKVNGKLLDDPRVELVGDVFDAIWKAKRNSFDAILLDVDNGPTSFVQRDNQRLYQERGFEAIRKSLTPSGKVAFWSAEPEPKFMKQLAKAGFRVKEYPAKAHPRAKRDAHRIYVGQKG